MKLLFIIILNWIYHLNDDKLEWHEFWIQSEIIALWSVLNFTTSSWQSKLICCTFWVIFFGIEILNHLLESITSIENEIYLQTPSINVLERHNVGYSNGRQTEPCAYQGHKLATLNWLIWQTGFQLLDYSRDNIKSCWTLCSFSNFVSLRKQWQ